MLAYRDAAMETRFRRISAGLGVCVCLIGALGIAAWPLHIEFLKTYLPGTITIKFNTALLLALLGGALAARHLAPAHGRLLARLAAGTALLFAVVTMIAYLLRAQAIPLDQLLYPEEPGGLFTHHPGRMAPSTAMAFILSALAFLTDGLKARWAPVARELLSLLVLLTGFMVLAGYLYFGHFLFYAGIYITPMSVPAALAFLLLGAGQVLSVPEAGLAAIASSRSNAGWLLRTLMPAAVIVPTITGWIRIASMDAGIISREGSNTVAITVMVVVLWLFIYISARSVLEQEMQKSAQEEKLRRSEEELADLYNNAPCGYHSLDKDGRFIKINDTELRMLGYSRGEVIGRMKLEEVMTPESAKRLRATFPSFLRNGGVKDLEFEFRNRNGATLNALVNATAVKNAAGEYQHSRSVVFDITERKRMEEELLSVNERLSEANKELEAFSYSVSHDLRAPLRGIAGFARILLEDHAPKLDAEARRVINVITGNTEKMGRLIDDLLAFSRVSRAEIACETVDMTALAREALGDAAQTRGAAGCAVPELLPAAGDRAMLKQVWANLLSNALKFTSKTPAPEITVSSARENGFTVYTVKDNGAGFDPAYASKLFGIFQRLHTEDEFEGTGVGLALCNRIITKHGGWMKAEGAAGKGAAFTFALPERKGSGT